ncbi:SRPBCC domain-containing protein [Streptomyces sp. Ncost-T10-10d]|uniref:SRPBCC family protein n=1 Tax=Streptomyces sp. Ncost-T10-10d TaxID=1839774 RepID=UPI00081D3C80|nr:SRPBCC domain-containing protein [Streptomyces sp. Ncost-T10-10d]SCF72966.1 Activator of Hsp90 ATPase homolog 1-like protein [Streptomyces sp. Ncost-T10-10d]
MADILQRIGVEQSSPEQVYDALTTLDGLSGWWTEKTSGETDVGGVIEFRFGPGGVDMKVAELDPGRLVRWDVVEPQEWIGTSVQWDLRQDGDYTIVLFKHEGWREPVEFMHHCSTKWAVFLMSLKQLLETGEGTPEPRDVKISDWH